MLLDCAKGVEAQTKKLFRVCKIAQMPIFTFVNKMDRPGRDPFDLIGEVESVLGIGVYPITWPIFRAASSAASTTCIKKHVFLFDAADAGSWATRGAEMAADGGDRARRPDAAGGARGREGTSSSATTPSSSRPRATRSTASASRPAR